MAARDAQPRAIYLKDYRPPGYLIDKTDLSVDLGETDPRVTSRLKLRRNAQVDRRKPELVLDGKEIKLESIAIDDRPLAPDEYWLDAESLTILHPPEAFELETVGLIDPKNNTSLDGL